MKKIEFETSKGRFRVVDEKDYMVFHLMLTENGFDCISLKEITEEEAKDIVDYSILKNLYVSYSYGISTDSYVYNTAIESLHSLLKSKGITELNNKYIFKIN